MVRVKERYENDVKILQKWKNSCKVSSSELRQLQLLLLQCECIEDKKAERIPYLNIFMVYEKVLDTV